MSSRAMRSCRMKSITSVKSIVFSGGIVLLAKVEVLLAQFRVLMIQLVQGLMRRITLRSALSKLLLDGLSLCRAEYSVGERIHDL